MKSTSIPHSQRLILSHWETCLHQWSIRPCVVTCESSLKQVTSITRRVGLFPSITYSIGLFPSQTSITCCIGQFSISQTSYKYYLLYRAVSISNKWQVLPIGLFHLSNKLPTVLNYGCYLPHLAVSISQTSYKYYLFHWAVFHFKQVTNNSCCIGLFHFSNKLQVLPTVLGCFHFKQVTSITSALDCFPTRSVNCCDFYVHFHMELSFISYCLRECLYYASMIMGL